MSKLREDTPPANPYARKAIVLAVVATVAFISGAVLTSYGIVCPTSTGMCLSAGINKIFSGASVFLLTAGTLLSIAGILFAVESIAAMEKTAKPYVALALLVISVLGIVGNAYQFVILKLVGLVFHVSL